MQIHALSACIANLRSHEVSILLIAPLLNHPETVPRPVQNVVVRLCRCHMDTELCGRMDEIHRFNPATFVGKFQCFMQCRSQVHLSFHAATCYGLLNCCELLDHCNFLRADATFHLTRQF